MAPATGQYRFFRVVACVQLALGERPLQGQGAKAHPAAGGRAEAPGQGPHPQGQCHPVQQPWTPTVAPAADPIPQTGARSPLPGRPYRRGQGHHGGRSHFDVSTLALVNPAYTSQIDSWTGLLQGTRRGDRFYCLEGAVLDADTNTACDIPARLYYDGIGLYTPSRRGESPARGTNRDSDGDCPPRTRVAGACNKAP